MVSVGVYTRKKFTQVSKLQYLGKTVKCKHSISEFILTAWNENMNRGNTSEMKMRPLQ